MYFGEYVNRVVCELEERNISYNEKLKFEIYNFCCSVSNGISKLNNTYPDHNDRYLKQCYYNLEEKADRGIISEEEWQPIQNFWNKFIKEKSIEENDE